MSARSVLNNLDPEKFTVTQIGIDKSGCWFSGKNVLSAFEREDFTSLTPVILLPQPNGASLYRREHTDCCECLKSDATLDVIFPVLHGTFGEDGSIQGLFELAGIAYVGAGVLGSAIGMDKGVFKELMRSLDIPVLPYRTFTRTQIHTEPDIVITELESMADYPFFAKPANLGSSVGITKCRNRNDLYEGLNESAQYDRRIIVEAGLEKPIEIEVSVLGNELPEASIPGEVIPAADFYTYSDKYEDGAAQFRIPADLTMAQQDTIRAYAVKAYTAMDCAGMARVDFLKDRSTGEIYLSEVNTIPGFTSISMYAKLWEASGLPYAQLIERLVDLAIQRKQDRDRSIYELRRAA